VQSCGLELGAGDETARAAIRRPELSGVTVMLPSRGAAPAGTVSVTAPAVMIRQAGRRAPLNGLRRDGDGLHVSRTESRCDLPNSEARIHRARFRPADRRVGRDE